MRLVGRWFTVFWVMALICVGTYWYVNIRPGILTKRYGAEIAQSLRHINLVVSNYEVGQSTEVLANVATGDYLQALLNYRTDMRNSMFRVVVVNVNIHNLKILSYSETDAKIEARIESANVSVYRASGEINVPCYGLAVEERIFLTRENGVWKIYGGGLSQIDTWTPVEVMRQSVCPENWESLLSSYLIEE